ncbi:pyridine nucleotide-disulfide oxidoreductase family protein [Mycobacterium kansasii 662]|uniref:Pyridine nucleotide-disulfide oxidoreductase family protein n=1 Tax=Mycobacterium kansasii 662 TaxID=1299326 RepID=X7ZHG2_MYCKA|nr:pyridine nucleotide-disulfide oxidoreductase family protein [Mycobacterium kansasii 662]
MTQRFDSIIVGAGQAGPSLASRLTGAGQRVAVVERKLIGGTCVNNGCIPTKTLVASAHAPMWPAALPNTASAPDRSAWTWRK